MTTTDMRVPRSALSSPCREDNHRTCREVGFLCRCDCHGPDGQQPPRINSMSSNGSATGEASAPMLSPAEKKRAWREANKDEIAEKQRAWREANKDEIAEKQRAYYEANKDEIAEKQRAWREANKDEIAEKQRAYYEANKDEIAEGRKEVPYGRRGSYVRGCRCEPCTRANTDYQKQRRSMAAGPAVRRRGKAVGSAHTTAHPAAITTTTTREC